MKALHIRQFPPDVFRSLKSQAALDGVTMRDAVIKLCSEYGKGR